METLILAMSTSEILSTLIYAVLAVVIGFICWGLEKLVAYLKTKINNEKVCEFLDQICSVTTSTVKKTYQTYVEAMKDEDVFDKAAQQAALNATLEEIKSTLADETKEYIEKTFGDLDEYLTTQIESTIYDLKAENDSDEVNAPA